MAIPSYALNDASTVKLWSKKMSVESDKALAIAPLIGTSENSIIQLRDETKKGAGDRVRFGLFTQLTGDGSTEGTRMEGNEEALSNWYDDIFINELNHSTKFKAEDTIDMQRVPFALREQAYSGLANWYADRKSIIVFAHACGYNGTTLTFEGLTKTVNLNNSAASVWNGNNGILAPSTNRILRAGAQATDEALISTNILTLDLIDKAVERAKLANPRIRPVRIDGENKYVMYIHPIHTTQLRTNTSTGQWLDITKAIYMGSKADNPFYSGAIGEYNGVILREHEHVMPGVNSTTFAQIATVRRAVLLGAQSLVMAVGEKTKENGGYSVVEKTFDYDREIGVAGKTIIGIKKTRFNNNNEDFGTIVVSTFAQAA